jgi:hypothetical protein
MILAGALGALLLATPAWAGPVGPLTTFSSNTPAVASEVNGNFTAVKSAVDDNATRIGTLETTVGTLGTTLSTVNSNAARKDAAAGNQSFDGGTLYLDYTNNRIGVSTSTPAVPLDVNGAVSATSYALKTARSGLVMFGGANMHPDGYTDEQWQTSEDGYGYIVSGTAGYAIGLSAPIHLPQGATVTALFCHVYDNDAASSLSYTARLKRRGYSNTNVSASTLAECSSSTTGPGAANELSESGDNSILNAVIDNWNYSYHLWVNFTVSAPSLSLRLYDCGVTYTYSELSN